MREMDLRDDIIVYFHNLRYDLSFFKGELARLQADGWTIKATLRKGDPIAIKVSKGERSFELRDSKKKLPGSVKSIGKMIGLPK